MEEYTEPKLIKKIDDFEQKSLEDNQFWRERALKNSKFYYGNQWDEKDLKVLKAKGKPALTFNYILPLINTLSGTERQNRQDYKILPRKGGIGPVAQVLTALCKHAIGETGIYRISDAFLDGIITGKGWLGFDIDFTNDPDGGDLVIEKISPFDILEDREATEYDLNTSARFIIRRKWVSRDWLELRYPEKKKELRGAGTDLNRQKDRDETFASDLVASRKPDELDYKYRWQVRECWWKEYERVTFLLDKAGSPPIKITDREEKLPAMKLLFARFPGRYRIVTRVMPRLRLTVSVGSVILEDTIDPLGGVTRFPIVRFCPYMLDDSVMGVVDNLIDPQQEVNKRSSQGLHHMIQTTSSGWIGDEDALSPDGWEKLEDFGSTPGQIIKKRAGKSLERINPGTISTGHLTMVEQSHKAIKDISGVNTDLMGTEQDNKSGRAMAIRQRAGLLVSEILFDNFTQSQIIFGQTLCDLIRVGTGDQISLIYSDEEIRRIVEEQKLQVNMDAVRDLRSGRYEMVVSQSQNSPTIRMATFEQVREMMQDGVPINPVHLVELSDVENKDEYIAEIRATQVPQLPPGEGVDPAVAMPAPTPQANPLPVAVEETVGAL
jgi:hypothetical protein